MPVSPLVSPVVPVVPVDPVDPGPVVPGAEVDASVAAEVEPALVPMLALSDSLPPLAVLPSVGSVAE